MEKKLFKTGIHGLDVVLNGGIRWGSSFTIASDLYDRTLLCHQIVGNALQQGFVVYYLCVKEAPERLRLVMEEAGLNAADYEKKRLLQFYTPLETERAQRLKNSAELIRVFNQFTKRMMRDIALLVMRGKKVVIVLNNVSAVVDLLEEDPRWRDFITKGSSWIRRLIKVISINIANLKDIELAESIVDFCIVMKNIDGISYIKVTNVSTSGWVPYRTNQNGIEIAEEFL